MAEHSYIENTTSMLIDSDKLIAWGGMSKRYRKHEIIFREGEMPRYYFQVVSGKVKLYNTTDTKELTQGIFTTGDGFGEPLIFIDEPYPTSAVAISDTVIIRLLKEQFFKLLDEYPFYQKKFLELFAWRIYEKSLLAKELINSSPEERITTFLRYYKKKLGSEHEQLRIDFTRQEIANFTGLCVETVIRTLSRMNAMKKVSIIDKKLYY